MRKNNPKPIYSGPGSNRRPWAYQTHALPTELPELNKVPHIESKLYNIDESIKYNWNKGVG